MSYGPDMQAFSLEASTNRAQLTASSIAHAAFVPTGMVTVLLGPLLPTLSARWSLNDSQAGYLVTAQFLGALLGTLSCGAVLPRFGFRGTISCGLVSMSTGVAILTAGPFWWALLAVFCYGIGIGLTIPTGNLLVAQVVPERHSSALNRLNFSWSAGAVACPFLLAAFQRRGHTTLLLYGIAGLLAAMTVSLFVIPSDFPEPRREAESSPWRSWLRYLWTPAAVVLGAIFFIYVGTENALGAWLASYAKRVSAAPGAGWVTVPSYFYGALLLGRVLAPLTLKQISDVKQAGFGAILALISSGSLLFARSVSSVAVCALFAGLGMSSLYPIAIGFLSQGFGAVTPRIASVMFALSTLGGATVPWLVGYMSTQFASLRTALVVAVSGCLTMFLLFRSSSLGKCAYEQGY
jgi:MFS transporter, FHS family, glucose/mannose:H+ symporter